MAEQDDAFRRAKIEWVDELKTPSPFPVHLNVTPVCGNVPQGYAYAFTSDTNQVTCPACLLYLERHR